MSLNTTYSIGRGEQRTIYHCQCDSYFSETKNTPLAELKTPVSRISMVLEAINDGIWVSMPPVGPSRWAKTQYQNLIDLVEVLLTRVQQLEILV